MILFYHVTIAVRGVQEQGLEYLSFFGDKDQVARDLANDESALTREKILNVGNPIQNSVTELKLKVVKQLIQQSTDIVPNHPEFGVHQQMVQDPVNQMKFVVNFRVSKR